ncbi:GNAT family N-acetyltransferase [Chishuiella sp.]|uniref:GNAT family N-acetyltransferase n=1 Tax=Chishuiella sp. TaxID=1969467 RepID=UPI0028AF10D4|nr:GNAT family N-acetyltransferase [Chishuiella sp.]
MIKRVNKDLKSNVKKIFTECWNTDFMVSKSKVHYIDNLESFVYIKNKEIIGIITFTIDNNEIEIVSLDSFIENKGIGTALINEVIELFRSYEYNKLWLITTNDNLNALKFYQKRGFIITDIYINAIEKSRKLKPSIPILGYDNIAILHEIQLNYYK